MTFICTGFCSLEHIRLYIPLEGMTAAVVPACIPRAMPTHFTHIAAMARVRGWSVGPM
uniref:Uncharacterized protein n=1 Tax=Anguilla anguilla TaxID=7936 RepID=A0A0E9SD28_ANGAN